MTLPDADLSRLESATRRRLGIAEEIAEAAVRIANAMPERLEAARSCMLGHPSAKNVEQDRTSGHTTVLDDEGVSMPAVSDPTGESAISAVMGTDRAAKDLEQLDRQLRAAHRALEAATDILERYQPRHANDYDAKLGQANPGCESCSRLPGAHGGSYWSPIFGAPLKLANGLTASLCRACRDRARETGYMPAAIEVHHFHTRGRWPKRGGSRAASRDKPVVRTERVQGGHVLVDCSKCAVVGVWPNMRSAIEAKRDHVCGELSTVPGKQRPQLIVGPPAGAQ